MNQPLREVIEWAERNIAVGQGYDGYTCAAKDVLEILQKYANDPDWICLEGMTVGELQAFDYGCAHAMSAAEDAINGKKRQVASTQPWEGLRKRLTALGDLWRGQRPYEAL